MDELEAGLDHIARSPRDEGVVELIVRRPQVGEREILTEAELDPVEGLVGDNWKVRGSSRTPDGSAHPEMQLNIMNSRAIELIAGDRSRWALAGDQLYIDLDLGEGNLPSATRLAVGPAIVEVTEPPHNGCKKFAERFGLDALKFVNSKRGRALHLRGINAKVVRPGVVRVGDPVRRMRGPASE